MAEWIDLLDPSLDEIRRHAPQGIDHVVVADLVRPASADPVVRPALQGYGDYVFGRLLAAVLVPEEDRVFYQEVDLVLTHDRIVTVRKTPEGEAPYDVTGVKKVCEAKGDLQSGMIAFHLLDDVAERYIELLEAFDDEIDELEEHIDEWSNDRTRRRLSNLRHDLLHIRRTLAPTRDAVRGIVDGRVDLEGRPLFRREVFPRDVERQFASVYDKLLRASESLELARDLLAAARDFHQTKIANDQNEVTKTLTVIASLLLLPTFIVGLYGQNFQHHFPEIHWRLGYLWSWALIVVTTFLQLWFFRRKRWI
jgi:magnesium transporter